MRIFEHWPFVVNCVSAVSLVFLNKHLMSKTCAFRSLGFLAAIHCGFTYVFAAQQTASEPKVAKLRSVEVVMVTFVSLVSLIAQNLSLLNNDVGVYQISKVAVIPACCVLEYFSQGIKISLRAAGAILVLVCGVLVA